MGSLSALKILIYQASCERVVLVIIFRPSNWYAIGSLFYFAKGRQKKLCFFIHTSYIDIVWLNRLWKVKRKARTLHKNSQVFATILTILKLSCCEKYHWRKGQRKQPNKHKWHFASNISHTKAKMTRSHAFSLCWNLWANINAHEHGTG